MLLAILLGEVEIPLTTTQTLHLNAVASVLCWVLEHSHNRNMEILLEEIAEKFRERGITETIAKPE